MVLTFKCYTVRGILRQMFVIKKIRHIVKTQWGNLSSSFVHARNSLFPVY